MENTIEMTRPTWGHRQYFLDQWKQKDITILVCQRKTKDNTQLCLESLLRWYPDCQILLVDGNSADDSLLYIKWLEVKNPNITVWERPNGEGLSSHGVTMHEALTTKITTKYVLLLDSDTIVERGGWIEDMLEQFDNLRPLPLSKQTNPVNEIQTQEIYAIGSLMLCSKDGEACAGAPLNEADTLRYAHPSCSMIDREKYLKCCEETIDFKGQLIKGAASDHGAPLVWNMWAAEQLGYSIEYYPVDKYVSHLSGASWTNPKTIWPDDHGVKLRPFVTFIVTHDFVSLYQSVDLPINDETDYEIVYENKCKIDKNVVIHGQQPTTLKYNNRLSVRGEYICLVGYNADIEKDTVLRAKEMAIMQNGPDFFDANGLKFTRRYIWQKIDCLKS